MKPENGLISLTALPGRTGFSKDLQAKVIQNLPQHWCVCCMGLGSGGQEVILDHCHCFRLIGGSCCNGDRKSNTSIHDRHLFLEPAAFPTFFAHFRQRRLDTSLGHT